MFFITVWLDSTCLNNLCVINISASTILLKHNLHEFPLNDM